MSKSNASENALLLLIFNNTNFANVGDATGLRGSSTAGSLQLSLHSADVGEAGNQSSNELTYTNYARVAVPRDTTGFTVANNQVTLTANRDFPQRTDNGAAQTATHWAVGTASSGTGTVLYKGVIGALRGFFTGLAAGDLITIPGLSGLAVDDRIAFYPAPGATLPAGMTEGTVYWVRTVSGNDVTISTTQGGAAVDLTGAGAGVAYRVTPISVTENVTPRLTTGTTITED